MTPCTLTEDEFRERRWLPLHEAVTDRTGLEVQAIIAAGNFPPTAFFHGIEYVNHEDLSRWQHRGYGRMLADSGMRVDPATGALVPRDHGFTSTFSGKKAIGVGYD